MILQIYVLPHPVSRYIARCLHTCLVSLIYQTFLFRRVVFVGVEVGVDGLNVEPLAGTRAVGRGKKHSFLDSPSIGFPLTKLTLLN